jgi:acetyl esterase/lipase
MGVPLNALLIIIAIVVAVWISRWSGRFIRAAEALGYLAKGSDFPLKRLLYRIEVHTDQYPHGDEGQMPYKVYRPMARAVAPAIVLYHGATPYGEGHPALDQLARALAHVGLLVFVPRLPRLQAVLIDETNLHSMIIFYRFIQGDERIVPGCISVAGTSFAGGLLLKALIDPLMQHPPPKAVLAYGSYCDLETTLRFVLTGRLEENGTETSVEPDRWAQVIFFYNYLNHIPGDFDRQALAEVLDYYIQDQVEQGDAARDQLRIPERRIADLILTPGNPESTALAEEVLQHARSVLQDLSPSNFHSQIQFPFWVLHGRNDLMVPYTEALALKQLLPGQVHMYVTNLYSHRDLGTGSQLWRTVRDMVGLIVYFGRFLHRVEG